MATIPSENALNKLPNVQKIISREMNGNKYKIVKLNVKII